MHAGDLLSKRADLTPDRIALVGYGLEGRRAYTYAELNARANQAANLLQARFGVQKGDRVSILAHNHVAYVDLLYGLLKIGAILTPLNWRLTAHELSYMINDCAPRVLIFGPEFAKLVAEMLPGIPALHLLTLEGCELPGALSYEDALAGADPGEPVRPELDGETPACILYTSGTTGLPKGAVLPHRQVLWNCINTAISWGLREDDVSPLFTPLFHSGGLFVFLTPLFYLGGRIVVARTFDANQSIEIIQNEGCTVVLGVPTLYQVWMNAPAFPQADFSRVRFFVNGGAPISDALSQAWLDAKGGVLRRGYGLTEVGVNCFSMTDADSLAHPGTVGKPIFHSEMRLALPESDEPVQTGEPGELWIRGPHVFSGYWNNPQATAANMQDGFFKTGDMARCDEHGYYTIVGRYKDMIKSGGENIYAAEVEAVFREHPAVADAALIGQPDEKWGEVGVMVVVFKPGASAPESDLLALCNGRLARFKIPRRIVQADSLPYSPYGKVIKAELRKQILG